MAKKTPTVTVLTQKDSEKKPERAKSKSVPQIVIDYPRENERVFPGHYAIRIGTPALGQVEVSIDKGQWQACRLTNGYYWFDWWVSEPGSHSIAARIKLDGKRILKSSERKCVVKP